MQFVPLLGEHGLEPVGPVGAAGAVPRLAQPLLSRAQRHRVPRVRLARRRALGGRAQLGCRSGSAPGASAAVWAALWVLYLSFVNVGQTFYGFGWETLLCEVGLLHDLRRRAAAWRRTSG